MKTADAFLVRISTDTMAPFLALGDGSSARAAVARGTADARLERTRERLLDALYVAVGALSPSPERARLIKLRRDVFNGRTSAVRTRDDTYGSDSIDRILGQLRNAVLHSERARNALDEIHETELERSRAVLGVWVRRPTFQEALALSNPVLSASIPGYTTGVRTGRRVRKLERALFRYATRMLFKATPFSRFCSIVPGTISGRAVLEMKGDPRTLVSRVRLNKRLLHMLRSSLEQQPDVRDHLLVSLNCTATESTDRIAFVSPPERGENVTEIGRNDALDYIVRACGSSCAGLTLGGLRSALANDPSVDATEEEIGVYIEKLADAGLVELRGPWFDAAYDWEVTAVRGLRTIDTPETVQWLRDLRLLRTQSRKIARGNGAERVRILTSVTNGVQSLPAGAGSLQNVLYEDVGAAASVVVGRDRWMSVASTVGELSSVMVRLSRMRVTHARLLHFFETRFPGASERSLVTVFNEFARASRSAAVAGKTSPTDDEFLAQEFGTLDIERDIELAERQIRRLIAGRLRQAPGSGSVYITTAELSRAAAHLSIPPGPHSAAFFCCVFSDRGQPTVALKTPSQSVGFGKYYSRFVDLMPQKELNDIRRRNASYPQVLAEIGGDGYFNPNVHPLFTAAEIVYPGAMARPGAESLPVSELVVSPDSANGRLVVRHAASGREIVPVDLGFQTPKLRPPLFRFLSMLTPPCSGYVPLPASRPVEEGQIQYRPRIVVDEHVVLHRRRWLLRATDAPTTRGGESGGSYFGRVREWAAQHQLPDRAYLRLVRTKRDAKPTGNARRRSSPKPQYMDFSSPLFVDLFAGLVSSSDGYDLIVQEAYPDHHQAMTGPDGPYASECLLQTYSESTVDSHPASVALSRGGSTDSHWTISGSSPSQLRRSEERAPAGRCWRRLAEPHTGMFVLQKS